MTARTAAERASCPAALPADLLAQGQSARIVLRRYRFLAEGQRADAAVVTARPTTGHIQPHITFAVRTRATLNAGLKPKCNAGLANRHKRGSRCRLGRP
jgi:hypothetical protein